MNTEQKYYSIIWEMACGLRSPIASPIQEEALLDAPLTGSPIFLSPNQMMYLFLGMQQKFAVQFQQADVVSYGFNTVRGIAQAIARRKASG